jgi:antitoxin MazE3
MSRQIAVRLPDEIVEFVDGLVSEGAVDSRADAVRRALARQRRESLAMRDAEILAAAGADADMDSLAEHVRRIPIDLR